MSASDIRVIRASRASGRPERSGEAESLSDADRKLAAMSLLELGARMAAGIDDERRSEQLAAGRVALKPLPRIPSRPFRAWLTVEQASLFVSNDFRGDRHTTEQKIVHPDTKQSGVRRVTVGTGVSDKQDSFGVLRQIHQEAYHKLLELWGHAGLPVLASKNNSRIGYGQIVTSGYAIVTAIRGGALFADDGNPIRPANHSGKDYARVRQLVRDLASIPIVVEARWDSGSHERVEFTLLQGITWKERKEAGFELSEESEEVSILFSDIVTRGFLDHEVKVMLMQPYEDLGAKDGEGRKKRGNRAEMARLLYRHVEGQLASKDTYTVNLDNLAERLGFARYRFKSDQIRKMKPAITAIDGLPIMAAQRKGLVMRTSIGAGAEGQPMLLAKRETGDGIPQLELF